MKDFLKYFKTGQLTDAEYVERLRKSQRHVKKLSWFFVIMGIVLTVLSGFAIAAIIKGLNVIPEAAQSNRYLMGLFSGVSIGMFTVTSFYVGLYLIAQGILLPLSARPGRLLVEYYDKLQFESAKAK